MSALHVACVMGRDECLRIMVEPAPGAKCQVDLEIKDKVTWFTLSSSPHF